MADPNKTQIADYLRQQTTEAEQGKIAKLLMIAIGDPVAVVASEEGLEVTAPRTTGLFGMANIQEALDELETTSEGLFAGALQLPCGALVSDSDDEETPTSNGNTFRN